MNNARTGGGEPHRGRGVLSPAEHLDTLLERAQNAFELDEGIRRRSADALMHQTELSSARQRNEPSRPLRCYTSRHIFLLADGSSLVLWELQHDTGEDRRMVYELYADEGVLAQAERRVHRRIGDEPPPREPTGEGTEVTEELLAAMGLSFPRRRFLEQGSAEHARRLLNRALNPDRPGEDVLGLLMTARAHDILRVPKPHGFARHSQIWCSLYEHAFLLENGGELSLWELEHNMTPDEHLVCEVYLEDWAAEQAADRHARALGVEL